MTTRRQPRNASTLTFVAVVAMAAILGGAVWPAAVAGATPSTSPAGAPAPNGLTAKAGSGVVKLAWTAPAVWVPGKGAGTAALLGYRVYRRVATADTPLATVPATGLGYVDYQVMNGHTYSYTVRALYGGKTESPDSLRAQATPTRADVSVKLVLGRQTAWVNGVEALLDAPAQLVGGKSTMVPLRFVGTSLGASLDYDGRYRRITATLGGRVVRLWVDDKVAEVDGRNVTLAAPPVLRSGRVLVPVRFIAEAFGAVVTYEARTASVTVSFADTDADLAGATTLTPGKVTIGVLNGPADIDVFRVTVAPGRTYRILVETPATSPDLVLTWLDAFLTSGLEPASLVRTASPGATGAAGGRTAECEIVTRPDETQLYARIQAVGAGGSGSAVGGPYRILVEDRTETQDTAGGATSLPVNGGVLTGALHTPSDLDYYSFQAAAGQDYAVYAGGDTSLALETAGGLPLMADARPPREAVAADDGRRLVWRCEETGLYLLKVALLPGALSGGAGGGGTAPDAGAPYALRVVQTGPEENENISQAGLLRVDHDAASGWLSRPGDQDWFSFPVSRGRRYYVQTYDAAPGCDTVLTLFGATGSQFAANDDAPGFGEPTGGSLVSFVATYDGLVFARVCPFQPSAASEGTAATTTGGRFTISATTTGPENDGRPDLATPLEPTAAPVTRSLVTGDQDWFVLTVVRGRVYSVSTSGLREGCDTDLSLYDSAWRLLAANDDTAPGDPSSSVLWTATFSGTVYALVSPVEQESLGQDGTGYYSMSLRVGP
jgi:hypothetical protein